MSDLFAARSQMALSLAFHIVFAVIGIGMPVLMALAERQWQRTADPAYLDLAQRWARGTAILFAVGAVSGTVLSFELGLLWPRFMAFAGPIIGMPFSLEGFAFFTEAIFLGIYLYGRDRIPPRAHLTAAVLVAVSGTLSGIFVVIANAWMNAPTGFTVQGGAELAAEVHPLAAMANPAALPEAMHMILAAYAAVGFGVAGIHALLILRGRTAPFHKYALRLALLMGVPAAILQPVSGDIAARHIAVAQPAKLAAAEALFVSQDHAPIEIGGFPDTAARVDRWSIRIPDALSLLAFHDPRAPVTGLDRIPADQWPNVPVVHLAFDMMVGIGTYLALLGLWVVWSTWRRGEITRAHLRAIAIATPLGFLAIEAGWVVTEVGRQPWIIYGVLRTRDAVTPMPGLIVPFTAITLLYVFLTVVVTRLLVRHVARSPQ
ncbi:MAG TPA: cytochrome ubiquinol oxidase subunit I [Gemmatimonadales bacterium]|nr:cytochrome ubiquinol oxidase subunit I [Gemmatimonadales bacterium]